MFNKIFEIIKRILSQNEISEPTMIKDVFASYFNSYKARKGKGYLNYVITSEYRSGNAKSNPHAIKGNAMDFTLRNNSDFSPIAEYNELFIDMLTNWIFRAGIDNTHGNIHIHIDLGQNRPIGQQMPYFFKEEDGRWTHQVFSKNDL